MILVTNATGFVGRAMVRRLAVAQADVRCLLQPSQGEQRLPTGIPFSTVSASSHDLPALRTAMQNASTVLHLMGEEDSGHREVLHTHAQDTANLIEAAKEAGVQRFIYLSRLGADRASAYPLFRIRGEAEAAIRESGLDYTILQTAITYGPEDAFTNVLVMLAKMFPLVLPVPETGLSRFQPLWIGDLTTCLMSTLERDDLTGQTISLGGPEHFTLEQMVMQILSAAGMRRTLIHVRTPLMHWAMALSDALLPRNPTPLWWLDLLTLGSATELGAVARHFGFEPCRLEPCLDYLRPRRPWRRNLLRFVLDHRQ